MRRLWHACATSDIYTRETGCHQVGPCLLFGFSGFTLRIWWTSHPDYQPRTRFLHPISWYGLGPSPFSGSILAQVVAPLAAVGISMHLGGMTFVWQSLVVAKGNWVHKTWKKKYFFLRSRLSVFGFASDRKNSGRTGCRRERYWLKGPKTMVYDRKRDASLTAGVHLFRPSGGQTGEHHQAWI